MRHPKIKNFYYPDRILGGSGSGKMNAPLNLVVHQPNTDKTYLYAKDPCEPKYQILTNQLKT